MTDDKAATALVGEALTSEEIEGLAALVEKMSPTPWKVQGPWPTVTIYQDTGVEDDWEPLIATLSQIENGPTTGDPDAAGIVALRNAAPALLSMVRQMGERVRSLRAGITEVVDALDEKALDSSTMRRLKEDSTDAIELADAVNDAIARLRALTGGVP